MYVGCARAPISPRYQYRNSSTLLRCIIYTVALAQPANGERGELERGDFWSVISARMKEGDGLNGESFVSFVCSSNAAVEKVRVRGRG